MATIKAGTYRFNDVLSANDGDSIEQKITFYIDYSNSDIIEGVTVRFYGSDICLYWYDYDYDFNWLLFELMEINPSELEVNGVVYDVADYLNVEIPGQFESYKNGWNNAKFGQTITIPEDTEVSEEFGVWFTANAVEQKQISGVWKFNEQITFPEDSIEQNVNFSVKLTYEGTKCVCFLDTMYVDSWDERLTGTSYGFDQEVEIEAGTGIGYHNGSWDWETWGDVVNIFDFGTEPQVVSDAFYDFVTANAIQAAASVQYNGERIANLFGGQTATLKCAGMTMESDVVVDVAEAQAQENVPIYDGVWEVTQWQST